MSMIKDFVAIAFILSIICCHGSCYKPVVFMHGLMGNQKEAEKLFDWIKRDHPGTATIGLDMYTGIHSFANMFEQTNEIGKAMTDIMNKHPDGVNLICHGQGGLICRGILEQFKHNVDTFISASAPQMGQFGETGFIDYFFPHMPRDEVYTVCYTDFGQRNISVCNYWRDPLITHPAWDLYAKFLATMNNVTKNPFSQEYKSNFIRLNRLVLLGSPDDGVIRPQESSQFGFYMKDYIPVLINDMKEWEMYAYGFGLKTLDDRGGLIQHFVNGVHHKQWLSDEYAYTRYILPYLT